MNKNSRKMVNKKSQMEIMGLAIIVLLLSIGLLFYLKFSTSKSSTTKQEFVQSERASNMLSVLLSTTTDCRDANIKNLLVDCANGPAIFCYSASSCDYSAKLIDKIFNKTFRSWGNVKYEFTASIKTSGSAKLLMRNKNTGCIGERETKFETIPLYPNPGNLEVKIEIC